MLRQSCEIACLTFLLWSAAQTDGRSEPPTITTLAEAPTEASGRTLTSCLVMLIDAAEIPAQEAGILAEIKVREGAFVKAGDLLAKIEDRRHVLEKELAEHEYYAALAKADNDVNVRYATATAAVAVEECRASEVANQRVPNSVAPSELRKLRLEHQRAVLQIEQSSLEQVIAVHNVKAATAKLETATENIRRRRIESPINGEIVETRRHKGEWVQAGDVVLHVVRLDRLKVEGYVKASQYKGSRIRDRNITVELQLPVGEKRELQGKIVFVSPLLQTAGDYRVWAEVDNRKEEGQWLLQPGQTVNMRVD